MLAVPGFNSFPVLLLAASADRHRGQASISAVSWQIQRMRSAAEATDGYLARIRLPGGLIHAEQIRVLARLAAELGDGRAGLTSRGNVQLRGLAADAARPLAEELALAGLLPSPGHDRVRNVLASPLAGLPPLRSRAPRRPHRTGLTGLMSLTGLTGLTGPTVLPPGRSASSGPAAPPRCCSLRSGASPPIS